MMSQKERNTMQTLLNMANNMLVPEHDGYDGHDGADCPICRAVRDATAILGGRRA